MYIIIAKLLLYWAKLFLSGIVKSKTRLKVKGASLLGTFLVCAGMQKGKLIGFISTIFFYS